MFSGGIFDFRPNSDDIFICSGGIGMNQQELLNTTRAVISHVSQHSNCT
jgi:hypothetical protein